MAVFAYKAAGAGGATSGVIVADSPRDARDVLRARGLTVQAIEPRREAGANPVLRWRPRGASDAKVLAFLRDLATLLGVGVPLLEAIDTVRRQHKGRFSADLLTLRDRVSAGVSLADAMREQSALFDELTVNITEVGENAGALDAALDRVAEFKERASQFKNRLATAMLYPAIVLVMAVGVSVLLMTVVVPNLLSALTETGRALPLPTRIVKAASDWLVGWWWLLGLLAIGVVVGVRLVLRSPAGRLAWHRALLRLPLIGELARKQAIVRLCVVLSTLLRSGMVFVRAIEITRRATPNRVLAESLARCEEAVQAGRDVSAALEETGVFPPVVVQIFAVGQQSGRLEEMLDRLATDYDRQVQTASQRLTAVLEPLLILGLVVLVGLIGLATILPLLEAADVA